jgi:hypothetical protein
MLVQGKKTLLLLPFENGSFIKHLLANMLHFIDAREVFDWPMGFSPFLLLYGHRSRFDLEFLQYITDKDTNWHIEVELMLVGT